MRHYGSMIEGKMVIADGLLGIGGGFVRVPGGGGEDSHKQRIFAFELICASSVDKSTDA